MSIDFRRESFRLVRGKSGTEKNHTFVLEQKNSQVFSFRKNTGKGLMAHPSVGRGLAALKKCSAGGGKKGREKWGIPKSFRVPPRVSVRSKEGCQNSYKKKKMHQLEKASRLNIGRELKKKNPPSGSNGVEKSSRGENIWEP